MSSFHSRLRGGFWVPRPTPKADREYWGTVTDPSGNVRDMTSAAEDAIQRADMAEEVQFLADRDVLDLGCGTGAGMQALRSVGASVVGVDPDERARALSQHKGFPAYASTESAPSGFDGLLCHHTVEHMDDPLRTIADALDLCDPGVRVAISTPDFNSPSAQHYGDRYRLLHDQTHISLFSTDSLVRMMESLGLEIIRVAHPFYGTRWEREALDWDPVGKEWSPPAPGNIVSVYAVKR